MNTYIIKYVAVNSTGVVLKEGTMRVKMALSGCHAQFKLECYLRKHVPDFHRLVVSKCVEENPLARAFSIFADTFKF